MNIRRHTLRLLAPLLILALLSSGAGSVALAAQTANGVATFHGDAARTGEQPGPAPEGAPSLTWQFETGDAVRSSPVIADGTLYIGSTDGFLVAIARSRARVDHLVDRRVRWACLRHIKLL